MEGVFPRHAGYSDRLFEEYARAVFTHGEELRRVTTSSRDLDLLATDDLTTDLLDTDHVATDHLATTIDSNHHNDEQHCAEMPTTEVQSEQCEQQRDYDSSMKEEEVRQQVEENVCDGVVEDGEEYICFETKDQHKEVYIICNAHIIMLLHLQIVVNICMSYCQYIYIK